MFNFMKKEESKNKDLEIVEKFLTDPNYFYSNSDIQHRSKYTDLAQKARSEIKDLKEQVAFLQKTLEETGVKKYTIPEYKFKNEEKLRPPAYIPSEQEIRFAKHKFVLEENVWDFMHSMIMYVRMLTGTEPKSPYSKESVEKRALASIENWELSMENWDGDLADALVDDEWFRRCYVDGLSDIHAGDCTAFPCSCMRCHAEEMFGVPYTAKWGKHEGHRLFSEYSADKDSKKGETK